MSIILRQPSWVASTGLSDAAQSMSSTFTMSLGHFSWEILSYCWNTRWVYNKGDFFTVDWWVLPLWWRRLCFLCSVHALYTYLLQVHNCYWTGWSVSDSPYQGQTASCWPRLGQCNVIRGASPTLTFFKSTMSTPSLYRMSSFRLPLPGANRIFLIHPRPVWMFLEVRAFRSQILSMPSTSPCTIWSFLNAMQVTVPTPVWNTQWQKIYLCFNPRCFHKNWGSPSRKLSAQSSGLGLKLLISHEK